MTAWASTISQVEKIPNGNTGSPELSVADVIGIDQIDPRMIWIIQPLKRYQ